MSGAATARVPPRQHDPDIGDLLTGPSGPFPRLPLSDPLERRWLHYAFVTEDEQQAMIANLATLGREPGGREIRTSVLLVHHREHGWRCSQWHLHMPREPWTSYRVPLPASLPSRADLELRALSGTPSVALRLHSTSTPAPAGVAHFQRTHWKHWQAQPGVLATGWWDDGMAAARAVRAVGYHERVHGRWGWPEMGGWVFGFSNELDRPAGEAGEQREAAPRWGMVFALLQPRDEPRGHTAMVMVWRRGRLVFFVPRRALRVSVAGQLPRDQVVMMPRLAPTLGTRPTAPIPEVLAIDGYQGRDWIQLRFRCRSAAQLVVPSETSLPPFSVHEVIGDMEVQLRLHGCSHRFASPGIVEFAGGAAESAWSALR